MAYTDWINIMDDFIPNKKELSILEFGLGDGTEYLLKKVIVMDEDLVILEEQLITNRIKNLVEQHFQIL